MKVRERLWYWVASFSSRHFCEVGNNVSVPYSEKSVLHLMDLEVAPHSYKETSHSLF